MNDIVLDFERAAGMIPDRPGDILRAAREERGMTIAQVAEVTRIAQRQLEAIERSDFASLPGTPYAVGFARAYARAVGADEVDIARGVREELGAADPSDRYEMFEPVDPARIPPRKLAWASALLALILGTFYAVWRTQFFSASTDQEVSDLANRASEQTTATQAQGPAAPTPPPLASGPVVLTARQDVWLRIYDAAGVRLLEKQMKQGESYTVPAQANNPMILTGRPDALVVTVGGKPVAPLGPPEKTIADVPISAAALLARPAAQTSGAPATSERAEPAPAPTTGAAPARPAARAPATSERAEPAPAPTTGAAPARPAARAPVSLSPATQRVLDDAASAATPAGAQPAAQ
ncbi:helix-turn-helix domain-containing protein [Sphingobium sp. DEHP117]|uniref:helix-turn-helix domain-containing protein n=1 Tax=Sphingobium sp. DEHP117 TaxID=2993436 RepID=UPI0027D657A2|nr:RodZ domain-containing protein [Sphingobium sp. DEHP117]MDQ4420462.1 helix-turn-helix domain-containing protein [Sphingobium sp. DEHP117]